MPQGQTSTGIDAFIDYVEEQKDVSFEEASEYLDIPKDTISDWVDFLVEENIMMLHYKFMKPYVSFLDREGKPQDDQTKRAMNQIRGKQKKFSYAIKTRDQKTARSILEKLQDFVDRVQDEELHEQLMGELSAHEQKLEDLEAGRLPEEETEENMSREAKNEEIRQKEEDENIKRKEFVSLFNEVKQLSRNGQLDDAKQKLIDIKHRIESEDIEPSTRRILKHDVEVVKQHLIVIEQLQKKRGETW